MTASWQESYDKPRQRVEKHSADKGPYSQGCGLPSSHVWLWELDHKEGRTPKNWCLWTVVLEKTTESPLDSKEIKPVNLKGNKPWILTGRINAELKFQNFGHLMWTDNSLEKSLMLGDIEGRRKRGHHGMRWRHRWNGHELGQTSGDGEWQGGLACCSPWGCKESDTTLRLHDSNSVTDLAAEAVQTCY